MIQALKNAWRLPDVRNKLLFTGFILMVYQFAAHVPVTAPPIAASGPWTVMPAAAMMSATPGAMRSSRSSISSLRDFVISSSSFVNSRSTAPHPRLLGFLSRSIKKRNAGVDDLRNSVPQNWGPVQMSMKCQRDSRQSCLFADAGWMVLFFIISPADL